MICWNIKEYLPSGFYLRYKDQIWWCCNFEDLPGEVQTIINNTGKYFHQVKPVTTGWEYWTNYQE